jgi:hypothetical protein
MRSPAIQRYIQYPLSRLWAGAMVEILSLPSQGHKRKFTLPTKIFKIFSAMKIGERPMESGRSKAARRDENLM